MAYVVSKAANHGTSNPIVARLSIQSDRLIASFPLAEETRKKIWLVLHEVVQKSLLSCYDLWTEVSRQELLVVEKLNKEGIPAQSNGRVASVETIDRLEFTSQSFLYSAKSALRGAKAMMIEFFVTGERKRKDLEDGDFQNLAKWARGKFGVDTEITKTLQADVDLWISEVYSKRNAVEHPGGKSGILEISNFTAFRNPETNEWEGVAPTWRRNQDPPSSISEDMEAMIDNTLRFTEDLLVHCLLASRSTGIPIKILEIPENERDPNCPIRLTIMIDRTK